MKPVIVIIGGGFCGLMTAVHLCKQATSGLDIKIINKNYPFANGVAYSAHTLKYLLNVPAQNMGAFPDKPSGFTDWLIQNKIYATEEREILNKTFQPRKLYGNYLKDVWQNAVATKPGFVDIEIINDVAEDIIFDKNQYKIVLENGNILPADTIVLATGNSKPQQLFVNNKPLNECKNYFENPWSSDCINDVNHLHSILIVGNGLTMIDTVLGLKENGFKGTIYTISPNGFSLMPHRHVGTKYNLLHHEIEHVKSLAQLRRIVYRHIIKIRNFGLSPELVTDALRSSTVKLWQEFTIEEKKIFLKELSYQWNVVRHRTPHHVYDYLLRLKDEKKFSPYTGTIKNFSAENGYVNIVYNNKISGKDAQLTVERIINCTGPNSNLKQSDNILLRNLALKGFIVADEFNLGIETSDDDYSIVDAHNFNHKNIFTLGSNLKGKLWESVAVPELRVQAAVTAKFVLKRLQQLTLNPQQ